MHVPGLDVLPLTVQLLVGDPSRQRPTYHKVSLPARLKGKEGPQDIPIYGAFMFSILGSEGADVNFKFQVDLLKRKSRKVDNAEENNVVFAR